MGFFAGHGRNRKKSGGSGRRHGKFRSVLSGLPGLDRFREPSTVTMPARRVEETQWAQDLTDLLCQIGAALIKSGTQTTMVTDAIRDIAARNGMRVRTFIVPTGLFVRIGTQAGGRGGVLDFMSVQGPDLRLDQVQRVQDLVRRMQREVMPISDARAELRELRELPQQFSPSLGILGYLLLTVGLGAIQHASLPACLGYAVLGAGVGVLREIAKRFPVLQTLLPVVAAAAVTAVAMRWAGPLLHEQPTVLIIAPLIAFLPGSALTMGAIDLATGSVLAGMGRLAGAVNVLFLLAMGILVGSSVVSAHPVDHPVAEQLAGWAGWVGVLLLGVGFALDSSAPRAAVPWVMVALLAERGMQLAGDWAGGTVLGAFAAGMLLPLLTSWIGRRSVTPDQVIFLPSFWMLVPGSTGLRGVSELLVSEQADSISSLVAATVTVLAIALGVVVGASLLRGPRLEVSDDDPDEGDEDEADSAEAEDGVPGDADGDAGSDAGGAVAGRSGGG